MQFNIANSVRRHDPYAGFKTAADQEVLTHFKAGATLYCWRVASPENWWLKAVDGRHLELPKPDKAASWGFSPGIHWSLRRLGKTLDVSGQRVLRSDLLGALRWGEPECETWLFDAPRVAILEQQWAEVEQGLLARETPAPANLGRIPTLSEPALALLRLVLAKGLVYPYPETFAGFQELEDAGLVRLNRGSLGFIAAPEVMQARVPRGRRADLRYPKTPDPYALPA